MNWLDILYSTLGGIIGALIMQLIIWAIKQEINRR